MNPWPSNSFFLQPLKHSTPFGIKTVASSRQCLQRSEKFIHREVSLLAHASRLLLLCDAEPLNCGAHARGRRQMVATYFHTVHSIAVFPCFFFSLQTLRWQWWQVRLMPHLICSPLVIFAGLTLAVNCTNYINNFQHLLLRSGQSMIEWLHFLLPMAWNAL